MSPAQKLLTCTLALMAMAAAQLFGIQGNYRCSFTGQKSIQAECRPDSCHPEISSHRQTCQTPSDEDHDCCPSSPELPPGDGHQHLKASDSLLVTSFPVSLPITSPVLFLLPPPLQIPSGSALSQHQIPLRKNGDPPEHANPPISQTLVETTVLLV